MIHRRNALKLAAGLFLVSACPRALAQTIDTPVVSHEHDFGADWPPARRIETNGKNVYLYVVPPRK